MTDFPTSDSGFQEDIEAELALPDDTGREHSTARILAMQILYEIDCAQHPTGRVIQHHLNRYPSLRRLTRDYTVKLVRGVLDELERLDMIVQTVAQEWPLDQVAIIDRNILRLAVYEYTMLGGLPVGVVADEAVNLAEAYGSDSSVRFINGVLGAIFSDEKRLQAMLQVEIPDDDDADTAIIDDDEESSS